MQQKSFQSWLATSYLSGVNSQYIEELYETYLKNPDAVSAEWRQYFSSLPKVNGSVGLDVSHADIRQQFKQLARQPKVTAIVSGDVAFERKQAQVEHLMNAYRRRGHLIAKVDPLGESRPEVAELELVHHDLSKSDLDTEFRAPELMGKPTAKLRDILAKLQQVYCGSLGCEYTYILNNEEVQWLQQRLEQNRPAFSTKEKINILQQLISADGLERYLATKYVGQKRFSLEGGDTLIPILQKIVNRGAETGLKGMSLCMAHRGRLNVLINVVGQSPAELFQEFEGKKDYGMTSGDVKYHLGFTSDVITEYGNVHLSLAFNPSHLEIISPVATGIVRAKQDNLKDKKRAEIMPVLIHGDAAFAGQGVVMETLNMSQTRAYGVGGSLHVVINNQVGFTTSDPRDARSSLYCTDVSKMIDAPIFHVNGDDPEMAVFITQLAVDYRMKFGKDIVVDLVCFRRLGHNEADEPAATQPLMYQKIRAHEITREIYAKKLIAENIITQQQVDEMIEGYRDALDKNTQIVALAPDGLAKQQEANWAPYLNGEWRTIVNTNLSATEIKEIVKSLTHLPDNFEIQRQVGLMMTARNKMLNGEQPIDWGCAETLAYAGLLMEGHAVRITGQDVGRGTFAHRHAVLHDQKTDDRYIPLQHLSDKQATFEIYDSLLSEEAVLGFEYGYASTDPRALVIWEAQYGDFANGAQVIIDQFISSGWQKWQRLSGLVMLLPHGYEGGGPEHSSARLERYLQLCAQNNMQVCVPTTPAQVFHMLRRQVLRSCRIPLIVMSPKALLRHKLAVSTLAELTNGSFKLVIPETLNLDAKKIRRVVLCSGKVYYDLIAKREEKKQDDVAIIRIEQLYPFPHEELKAELDKYPNAKQVIWCQEEPKNQGAWYMICHRITEQMRSDQVIDYAGRPAQASPAVGYPALHKKQQEELVEVALK